MKIIGAILNKSGLERPYSLSMPLEIREIELDQPGPEEIRVRIEAAGVCHSDLSVIDGNRPRPLPMLLGHEAAGIVDALGPGVSDLEIGQRVIMTFLPRCGTCDGCKTDGRLPCTLGSASNSSGELLSGGSRLSVDGETIHHHLGVSAFASHAVVDRRSVVAVDSDVPPDVAAVLGCAVLTGGGALINSGQPAPGSKVIVLGLGGVGMAAVMTGVALGLEVIAVDRVASKLALATELGARFALTPEQATEGDYKAHLVVEAVGHPSAFETAIALTSAGGKTVTVGLPRADARSAISPLLITAEARTIIGSYLGSSVPKRDIPMFADLWRSGLLPVERLISGTIELSGLNLAMDQLADGTTVRQIIRFD